MRGVAGSSNARVYSAGGPCTCAGRMATRPTKRGGTMQVCLDDKYSTCIQNNLKGGWTQQRAARYDRLKEEGKVK